MFTVEYKSALYSVNTSNEDKGFLCFNIHKIFPIKCLCHELQLQFLKLPGEIMKHICRYLYNGFTLTFSPVFLIVHLAIALWVYTDFFVETNSVTVVCDREILLQITYSETINPKSLKNTV